MTKPITWLGVARWAVAIFWFAQGGIALAADECADDCKEGIDYQTIDYFTPPKSDYSKYVFQGGFPYSLCNAPHGPPPNPFDVVNGALSCDDIDLKGYLYLPKAGNSFTAKAINGVGAALSALPQQAPEALIGAIRTTEHDLPLIVYADGSWPNKDDPSVPNPCP